MGGTHAGPKGRVRLFPIRLFRVVALQVLVNGGWTGESGVIGPFLMLPLRWWCRWRSGAIMPGSVLCAFMACVNHVLFSKYHAVRWSGYGADDDVRSWKKGRDFGMD